MRQRISPVSDDAKVQLQEDGREGGKTDQKCPKNANDHEQQARVHPAQPYYSVVVPAPEL
jgi:hypothetical protein